MVGMVGMVGIEYSRGRTLAAAEGVGAVVTFLAMLVVVVAVVVLVVRGAAAASGPGGAVDRRRASRAPRRPRATGRPIAPDDDPEFLRELDRRRTRGDGTPG
jgi:hypothetical protein